MEVVNDNLQIEGVDYDDGDLSVPVELPANLVITPCLSWAMKNLEIDGVNPTPPLLEACT